LAQKLAKFWRLAGVCNVARNLQRISSMDPLTISAASGMRARIESLDILANNIANLSTSGFKADREAFLPWLSSDAAQGELQPTDSPFLPRHWTDQSQGPLARSGEPLDFAIQGRGFFQVQTQDGARWTRNGGFQINRDGKLQTCDGSLVKVRPASGNDYQLNPAIPVEVNADGSIRQAGAAVGTIEVVDFENSGDLEKQGASYFRMDVSGALPRPARGFEVKQGYVEGANASAAESSVRLVSVMRQFEALQKAAAIGADMNRRAVEEVARVSG
jgi:flagellar basal-body rod protein FlgF